jgi:hypothetical protein
MKLQLRDPVQIVIFAYETGVNRPAPAANRHLVSESSAPALPRTA